MSDEASDVSAAMAGCHAAFGRLYDRHAGVVRSLCRQGTSAGEADDALQETFLRAYRKLGQLAEPGAFGSWVYSIARRVCAERRRAAGRRQRAEGQAMANQTTALRSADPSIEQVEQREQLDRLTAALDTLPENERLAVHLFYLDADPPQAAATALGLSRSGFYKLVARARKRLASAMREAQPT